jgi:hypothetical protein
MKNKLIKCFVCCILLLAASKTYAQNNPYVDDRIVHYGWFLGGEILSYDFRRGPAAELGGAFTVGGIIDLKLAKYLSLRFLPSINFGTLVYSGKTNIITTPLCLPLYLKWTASREMNFRPYVTVGAGVQVEMNQGDSNDKYRNSYIDAFVGGGFGCDLYFRWFKLCPEIRYQIGLLGGVMEPGEKVMPPPFEGPFQQRISVVFNFE